MNNNNPSVISGNEQNFAQTVSGTGYTPKIRITFSYSITSHYYNFEDRFNINAKGYSLSSTTITSPFTIDKLDNSRSGQYTIFGPLVMETDSYHTARAALRKKRDVENNRVIFSLLASDEGLEGGNYGAYFTVSFTITKIEQYY